MTQDDMQHARGRPDVVAKWEETKELTRAVSLPWEDLLDPQPATVQPEGRRYNALAEMLWDAERTGRPARRLRALLPELSVQSAYAIRREVDLMRMIQGAAPVGRKIGLSARELQERFGAEEPFWAYVFSTGRLRNGATLDLSGLLRPQLEPELAVLLGQDLDTPGVTKARATAAIATVQPAFEIVDQRTDVEGVDLAEAIADSGWNAGFLLGDIIPAVGIDLDAVRVRLTSAVRGELRSGGATELMDGPAGCLAWLAEKMIAIGEPLRAGELILTGTMAGAVPIKYSDTITAEFSGLGPDVVRVSVSGL
jgi:2-keto-4-pentenoate hydratase